MDGRNYQTVLFISLSQFGIAFCFHFVMVFIPFLIHDISLYSPHATLVWVGLIMGAPNFVSAISSTFWGSLTTRSSPKLLFMRGMLSHAILMLVMAFVSSLPILLLLRILQGVLGGISTVGFVIVSSSSSREWASRDIGLYQNSMTLGQLVGPPIGALAASTFGYKGAFISASALVFVTLAFCFFYVTEVPHETKDKTTFSTHAINKRVVIACGICFTVTVQLMFLPGVLPDVFKGFNIEQSIAVRLAGLVVMLYTATAMAGTFLLCRLAAKVGVNTLIIIACILGVILQAMLAVSPGIISFITIRMLKTATIAAVLPLVFSACASNPDGRVIGLLNSSRFAGGALGPIIGTTVLAVSSLNWLYLSVSGLGLLALLAFGFYSDNTNDSVGQA
jgi:MFS transporter, DHA1 family, multidrug resistance protein